MKLSRQLACDRLARLAAAVPGNWTAPRSGNPWSHSLQPRLCNPLETSQISNQVLYPGPCHLNLYVDDSVIHGFDACTETIDDGVAAFFLKATHVHAGDVDPCSQQDLELSSVTLVTDGLPKANVVITSHTDEPVNLVFAGPLAKKSSSRLHCGQERFATVRHIVVGFLTNFARYVALGLCLNFEA